MERLLTAKELARLLKVHESTIYRQVKEGRLPIVRIAAWRYRFKLSHVMAALIDVRSKPRLRLVRGSKQMKSLASAEAS
jgi:excisionase family DNA binding protein